MRIIFFLFFSLLAGTLHAQSERIEVELFINAEKGKNLNVYLVDSINKPTKLSKPFIAPGTLIERSIMICYRQHHFLVPKRQDSINQFKVYFDNEPFKNNIPETVPKRFSLVKRKYYVDLGLDVVLIINRSKRKFCKEVLKE